MQERIERSRAGQVVLTLLMVLIAAAVIAWNLPAGAPRDRLRPTAGHVLLPVGLDQDWSLFAPDPRSFSVGAYARVFMANGEVRLWTPPRGGPILAPYRDYRWQKYVERLRADEYAGLWEPTARWVARQQEGSVRRVELVRTFRLAIRPGDTDVRPARQSFTFFTLDLP
ncbi:MAG TPA: hypothetical protein VNA30_06560 [Mycobacteriales bacterium]|nr:hypothetical protein [Mycobacteriales bacterium]